MVKIAVFSNGFTAIGHADYAQYGQDIVCSAISALTQTAMLGLKAYCNAVADVHEGNMSVHIAYPNMKSIVILETMLMGLEEIQKQYPEYIQIKERLCERDE